MILFLTSVIIAIVTATVDASMCLPALTVTMKVCVESSSCASNERSASFIQELGNAGYIPDPDVNEIVDTTTTPNKCCPIGYTSTGNENLCQNNRQETWPAALPACDGTTSTMCNVTVGCTRNSCSTQIVRRRTSRRAFVTQSNILIEEQTNIKVPTEDIASTIVVETRSGTFSSFVSNTEINVVVTNSDSVVNLPPIIAPISPLLSQNLNDSGDDETGELIIGRNESWVIPTVAVLGGVVCVMFFAIAIFIIMRNCCNDGCDYNNGETIYVDVDPSKNVPLPKKPPPAPQQPTNLEEVLPPGYLNSQTYNFYTTEDDDDDWPPAVSIIF